MTDAPKTNNDLREMVYHTDARVTAMEGQMSNIATNQAKDSQKLDNLVNALNQPRNVNYAAWVGVGLTAVALLIGGTIGMVNYITLTQDPLSDIVVGNTTDIDGLHEFQRATHHRFGEYEKMDGFHENEIFKLWAHIHKQEDIDREHDKAIAASEVARRAMGDYMKDIDAYGSRRWMPAMPPK